MDDATAARVCNALGLGARLEVVRFLAVAGPAGVPQRVIARAFNIPANTMSGQLTILARAGLVAGRRNGQEVFYTASVERLGELAAYLADLSVVATPASDQRSQAAP